LRRELLAMPHADCESLWRELLRSQAELGNVPPPAPTEAPPPIRGCRIPESFLRTAHPGEVLLLESADKDAVPILLSARQRFTIGRSAGMADFVAHVLPENEANNARTNRLSRVHTLLEISDGQIALRDGNGTGPSLNGSFLDDQALTPIRPTILPHRGRLVLGNEFALDLIPLPASAAPTWKIENLEEWVGPGERKLPAPCRAMVCEPVDGHAVCRHGVWLFSEVGFGLDAAGRIIWDTRGRRCSPAEFYYFRGCFWLRNDWLPASMLAGNDTPLSFGEILPLAPGQKIHIGNHDFTVQIQ